MSGCGPGPNGDPGSRSFFAFGADVVQRHIRTSWSAGRDHWSQPIFGEATSAIIIVGGSPPLDWHCRCSDWPPPEGHIAALCGHHFALTFPLASPYRFIFVTPREQPTRWLARRATAFFRRWRRESLCSMNGARCSGLCRRSRATYWNFGLNIASANRGRVNAARRRTGSKAAGLGRARRFSSRPDEDQPCSRLRCQLCRVSHCGKNRMLVAATLGPLGKSGWIACGFVRVHRFAAASNRTKVAALTADAIGYLEISLLDDATVAGSRRYRAGLSEGAIPLAARPELFNFSQKACGFIAPLYRAACSRQRPVPFD